MIAVARKWLAAKDAARMAAMKDRLGMTDAEYAAYDAWSKEPGRLVVEVIPELWLENRRLKASRCEHEWTIAPGGEGEPYCNRCRVPLYLVPPVSTTISTVLTVEHQDERWDNEAVTTRSAQAQAEAVMQAEDLQHGR